MRRYVARLDAVLIQAVIAGALSFSHLHDLAAAAGQQGWKAWAYPISVDLLLVAAWRRLRSGHGTAPGWCWSLTALVASLGANIATAGLLDLTDVPAWLRILVAGWPAVAFLGGTLLAHAPKPDGEEEEAQEIVSLADSEAQPPTAHLGSPSEPLPSEPVAPELEPVAAPAPAPAPQPVAAPSSSPVPAALVDHARKVAATHRDRTGEPTDTDTLRARLGVPPALAQQIATQLI
ncbi:SpdA protein [Streptomyces rimosus]|uniref:DUF2637 domain-containing protein n=1 Tax=Streptomyces rimosus TaxID=1927 RepID=UPI0004D4FE4B|nr:DUF2637 domain-containing protein [Streptomyces rimosus]KEF21157.1 SpdA protein [Streptomyces rimosus]